MLRAHGVKRVIDVRTIPKSRHNPQFAGDALKRSLHAAGVDYLHMPGLGGLRHPRKDSINTAWQSASFRGYADYMQTEEFERNLEQLIATASERATAIMCAEAVPWRCHRSLVADALSARGIEVEHILSATSGKPHSMTPFAKVKKEKVTYPGLLG